MRNRLAIGAATGIALMVVGGTAPARTSDSASWFKAGRKDSKTAGSYIRAVAQCIVRNDKATWSTAFMPAPDTGRNGSEAVKTCVYRIMPGVTYSVPNEILLGSVAEAFYVLKFPHLGTLNSDPFYVDPRKQEADSYRRRLTFMDCVLQKDPAQADQLLRSAPDSDDERMLAVQIAAAASDCSNTGEKPIGIKSLRAGLGDVMFRRSLPAGTSSGTAN